MSILQPKPAEQEDSSAGFTWKECEPSRRQFITQTRKGLRRIESKKALQFVLKDPVTHDPQNNPLLGSRSATPMIKLFSFELDQNTEDNYRKLDSTTCLHPTNTSLAAIPQQNIQKQVQVRNCPSESPKMGIFEVSDSPASRSKAALGTPRFSTLAADRHHIFNRPMKIKVMINRTHSEECRSMPRIWGNPDSLPELRLVGKPKYQESPSGGQKRIFPFVKVIAQTSSPQASANPLGPRKSFLLRRSYDTSTTYKYSSPSSPSLQSSKSSSKSIDGGARGLQSGIRTHNVSPLVKRTQPTKAGPNQPLVSVMDIQQIIRKQRLQECPISRQLDTLKPEFEVSVDMKKKTGPFFFKKR